jgi:hypothetical protein
VRRVGVAAAQNNKGFDLGRNDKLRMTSIILAFIPVKLKRTLTNIT